MDQKNVTTQSCVDKRHPVSFEVEIVVTMDKMEILRDFN